MRETVCKCLSTTFALSRTFDFRVAETASAADIASIEDVRDPPIFGPTDILRFDFKSPAFCKSTYNSFVIDEIIQRYLTARKNSRIRLAVRNEAYIRDKIHDVLGPARTAWKRGQPQRNEAGAMETPEERDARFGIEEQAYLQSGGRATRRIDVSLFFQLKYMAQLRESEMETPHVRNRRQRDHQEKRKGC